jgi:hypothetical protein
LDALTHWQGTPQTDSRKPMDNEGELQILDSHTHQRSWMNLAIEKVGYGRKPHLQTCINMMNKEVVL